MDETLDFAPCGYISFGDDGTVILINQTLAELLDVTKEKAIGKSVENLLTLASRIFYNTHLFPLLRLHERADEIFLSLRGSAKKDVPVLLNAKRKRVNDQFRNEFIIIPVHQRKKYEDEILAAKKSAENVVKENVQLLSVTQDLETRTHELDKQYSRLLSMNKDLLQFSKIISHDVQETLHKMNVFTDKLFIQEKENLSTKGKQSLEKISKAAERASELIHGLTQFININSDREIQPLDVNKIINTALVRAKHDTKFSEFTIAVDSFPSLYGNGVEFETMFYHLLTNSIKYRNPDQDLSVTITNTLLRENAYRLTKDKYFYTDHTKIHFSDNGSGFDQKYGDRVFDLFTKIHPQSLGIGIGLSLAKKIVENHEGSITAKSELGKGTVFTIILPLLQQSQD